MAEECGMASVTVASLEAQLPEPFPDKFQIGSDWYGYRYTLKFGCVWQCSRSAEGQPTTGPDDTLFMFKSEGLRFAVHAPRDVTTADALLGNLKWVFSSRENVLLPGMHTWCWYDNKEQTWEPMTRPFETKHL